MGGGAWGANKRILRVMIALPSKPLPVVALRQLASCGSFPVHLRVFLFPSCFREPASYNLIVFLILQYILWDMHHYMCLNLQFYREIGFASCGSLSICALSRQLSTNSG